MLLSSSPIRADWLTTRTLDGIDCLIPLVHVHSIVQSFRSRTATARVVDFVFPIGIDFAIDGKHRSPDVESTDLPARAVRTDTVTVPVSAICSADTTDNGLGAVKSLLLIREPVTTISSISYWSTISVSCAIVGALAKAAAIAAAIGVFLKEKSMTAPRPMNGLVLSSFEGL